MTVNSAMVFAAGFGTRMGALTAKRPKPLIEVQGKALVDYTLDLLYDAGVSNIVANTHYLADQMEAHLAHFSTVKTIRETPDILETGGGLKNALPALGEAPVFTANADVIWTGANPCRALQQAWDPRKMDALLMLVPKENAIGHSGAGDFFLAPDGSLTRRGKATSAPYIYASTQILKTDRLGTISENCFSLNKIWDQMIAAKRLFGIVHTGGWVDVGNPAGIKLAEQELTRAANV